MIYFSKGDLRFFNSVVLSIMINMEDFMKEKIVNTFDDLIQQINQTAGDIQRERGTLFEKLVLAYLKNEPIYQRLYKNTLYIVNISQVFL